MLHRYLAGVAPLALGISLAGAPAWAQAVAPGLPGGVQLVQQTVVIAPYAPPPPPAETAPPSRADAQATYWQPGRWSWTGANWAWLPGHYVVPPQRTATWVPGQWVPQAGGGYAWVTGHWE